MPEIPQNVCRICEKTRNLTDITTPQNEHLILKFLACANVTVCCFTVSHDNFNPATIQILLMFKVSQGRQIPETLLRQMHHTSNVRSRIQGTM